MIKIATVGELSVKLGMDSAGFDKGMKNAEKTSGKMNKGLATMGKVALGAVGAIAAVGAGALALGVKVGDMADELLDLEAITGMTTDSIQQWRKVTEVAGVSTDAMTNASFKLTKQLDVMSMESNKGNKQLKALGISLEELEGMSADERMDVLTKKLAEVENETDRARIGTDLFGGSWKEIAPVVSLGAEAMDKAKASANVFSKEQLETANQFRITIANVKDQVSFFFMELAMKLLPTLQAFFDWVSGYMPQIKAIMSAVFTFIGDIIGQVVGWIQELIGWFKNWGSESEGTLSGIWESFQIYLTLLIDYWKLIFDTVWSILKGVFDQIVPFIQEALEMIKQFWDENGEQIMQAVENVFAVIQKIIETVMPIIQKVIEVVMKAVLGVIKGALNVIMGLIKVFVGLFTGDWEKMGEGLKQIWSGIWNAIESVLKGAWSLLSGAFKFLWDKIAGWFTGLKDDALQWGKNMISGFIDGIKNKAQDLANAAKDAVAGMGDYLKFWSPAKKGEGRFIVHWGENMIDGFLDGVRNAMPDVANTLGKVIPDMSTSLSPSMAGMGSTSNTYNGGDIVIQNMSVRSDNDIKLISRELHTLQTNAGRGRG